MQSTYLKKEINLNTAVATTARGRQNTIVFHHELENLINEVLPNAGICIRYDFVVYNNNLDDVVVKCEMWDSQMRRVVTIGEATPSTLNSTIEKAFPTTMAMHRAFDRAAIRFLGLGMHVYSNMEMDPDGPVTTSHTNLVDDTQAGTAPVLSEKEEADTPPATQKQATNMTKTESTTKVDEAPAVQPVAHPTPATNNSAETEKTVAAVEGDDGNVIVTIGKYAKGNKTIAEIFVSDRSWLEYVIKNIQPKNEDYKKQLAAAKRYLAAHA